MQTSKLLCSILFLWASAAFASVRECEWLESRIAVQLQSVPIQFQNELPKPSCQFVMQRIQQDVTEYTGGAVLAKGADWAERFPRLSAGMRQETELLVKKLGADVRYTELGFSAGGFTVQANGRPLLVLDRHIEDMTVAHERAHVEHALEIADYLQAQKSLDRPAAMLAAINYLMTPQGTMESEARAVLAELRYSADIIKSQQLDPYNLVGVANYPALQAILRTFQLEALLAKGHPSASAKGDAVALDAAIAEAHDLRLQVADDVAKQTQAYRQFLGITSPPSRHVDFFPSVPESYLAQQEQGEKVLSFMRERFAQRPPLHGGGGLPRLRRVPQPR